MLFNIDKCKTLHIDVGNLNGKEVHEERDLGIMITKDLKCSKQCLNTVKIANKYSKLSLLLPKFFITRYPNCIIRKLPIA